jgi:SAM-dependent MidA family methyltransferase
MKLSHFFARVLQHPEKDYFSALQVNIGSKTEMLAATIQ